MRSVSEVSSSKLPVTAVCGAAGIAAGILISRNLFGTERKIHHDVTPEFCVSDPAFRRTMSALLGPPLLEGNEIQILKDGREIFTAMLDEIENATTSITFENFVWWEGELTRKFARALSERAAAGVKVHILQDAMGCKGLRGPSMNQLRDSRAELEIFRWLRFSRINLRTHRKLLVIDGRIGFIGGAGISDDWDETIPSAHQWRDTHYRVTGPAVAQIQRAFADNWMQTRARVLFGDEYFPALHATGTKQCQAFRSSASEGADNARVMFLLSIASARRSIRIANAYFVPDHLLRRTLIQARQRGVQIEIITAGPKIDQKVVRLVGRGRWKPLLEAGIRFYEFQPARYHCKYMIVDDCWVSAGSANFDNRSLRLNDEANLNVLDHGFAAEHIAVFEEDKERSIEITPETWAQRSRRERAIASAAGLLRAQM